MTTCLNQAINVILELSRSRKGAKTAERYKIVYILGQFMDFLKMCHIKRWVILIREISATYNPDDVNSFEEWLNKLPF